MKDKELGERLLLPNNILRSGEDVFLDDYTLDDVKTALKAEIVITPPEGGGFIEAVLGGKIERKANGNFVYIKAYDN